MLADCVIFGKKFYPLYVLAFVLEIIGVIIFSSHKPQKKAPANF
jgi:hypothetical protein